MFLYVSVTCREPADIYVVLDSSGSMSQIEFELMRDFAKSIIEDVGVCINHSFPT